MLVTEKHPPLGEDRERIVCSNAANDSVSIHYRRRQEFEVADLELPSFVDENDLQIEIRIKIVALLQLLDADAVLLGHRLKFLRREFSVDLPAQTRAAAFSRDPVRHCANGEHGVHRAELFPAAP